MRDFFGDGSEESKKIAEKWNFFNDLNSCHLICALFRATAPENGEENGSNVAEFSCEFLPVRAEMISKVAVNGAETTKVQEIADGALLCCEISGFRGGTAANLLEILIDAAKFGAEKV